MIPRVYRVIALLGVLGAVFLSCGSPEERPVAEASGGARETSPRGSNTTSDVPVEALGSLEKLFVPLATASLQSLDDALEQKGYGNVKSADFAPKFQHVETSFGPAVVAFTSTEWIASQSMYQPMSVTQWLEASLGDEAAKGVIINPEHPGQILALSKNEVLEVLTWLPPKDPLPMEIYVTQ
jgi:hypothetical protein